MSSLPSSSKAVVIEHHGGAEQLRVESLAVEPPASGEVQIHQRAAGLNFIDVYDRTGLYPHRLPAVLGREGAGEVIAVGKRANPWKVGDRVAYALNHPGAYCEYRNVPADRLVEVPQGIPLEQAAAIMLKGLTAQYLVRSTFRVKRGDSLLIHAAAGGVGSIVVQWGKSLGAQVIGVVGSEAKAERARELGCDHVIVGTREKVPERVREVTAGRGVAVVYDANGKDTFLDSLDSLAPLGTMVTFGNSSGPVPPIAPLELSQRGSLFLTRPNLFNYVPTSQILRRRARELFALVAAGQIRIPVERRYALDDAAQAHRDLESRRTVGCTVLIP